MKTTKLIFLIFACFGLLFGCSQYEMPDDDLADLDLKKAVKTAVFMVEPSGGNDTPALMQAFEDATMAGPGAVVQLAKGEFHVGYMEIYDFCGALKGAGKGKTIITVLPGLNLEEFFAQHLLHSMVKFVGGDVHLSHFTMQTPPGQLSTGWPHMGHIYSLMHFSTFNPKYEFRNESRSINVVIDNVSFKGHYLEGGPGYVKEYNCFTGVKAGFDYFSPFEELVDPLPREKIDFKITNCDFDTFVYGLILEGMKNSRLIVGEKNKGNTFNNIDQQGGVWESRSTVVSIEGNTFNIPEFSYGLDLDDYSYYGIFGDEPSKSATMYNVSNNQFNLTHAEYALWLRNKRSVTSPKEPTTLFQIRNNQFSMADGYEWALIGIDIQGMVMRNNRLTGLGDLALYLVGNSQGGLVLGNNFSSAVLGTGLAFLGRGTRNWSFVGGNFTDKVIDLGVNNVFTGMNVSTSDQPLGRSISEKLAPMNHLMK